MTDHIDEFFKRHRIKLTQHKVKQDSLSLLQYDRNGIEK